MDDNTGMFQVFIKHDKTMVFNINSDHTPTDLYTMISLRLNIPSSDILLTYRGKPYMRDDIVTFGEYGVFPNTTFIMYCFPKSKMG